MKRVSIALALLLVACTPSESEILVQNLDVPWEIAFFDDDSFLFTERDTGKVSHYNLGQTTVIGTIASRQISEGGLLGIAIDPEFEKNNFVYVYYTYAGDEKTLNRVSRFVYDQTLKDETVMLDAIPGAPYHNGGRLEFGPDGKLYITTGDAANPSLAQDLSSTAGKILRMNKDGSVPEDNPFPDSFVYSYGHRNSQGLAWYNGVLFAPEHGPTRNDEINVVEPGQNYGWSIVECDDHSGYPAPIRCFDEFTLAPGGATFDDKGNLYVAGLRGAQVRTFVIRDGQIITEAVAVENLGRIREVKYHEGYLYVATSNQDGRGIPRPGDDKIIRIPLD